MLQWGRGSVIQSNTHVELCVLPTNVTSVTQPHQSHQPHQLHQPHQPPPHKPNVGRVKKGDD